ncbi:MAG: hypothetical protein ABR616_15715 [Dermatophilaceae bacterium]|nr:hypothetical protein [Intrasporangiaceae bacterium]
MATKVVKKRKRSTTGKVVGDWFRQFRTAEKEEKAAAARKAEIKKRFMDVLEREGYEDEKGHRYLDLPEEIDGVAKVCRQKRVSQGVNVQRAQEFLNERDLWKKATRVERVLDESKLAQLVFEGEVTQAEFDALIDRRESYAFIPVM